MTTAQLPASLAALPDACGGCVLGGPLWALLLLLLLVPGGEVEDKMEGGVLLSAEGEAGVVMSAAFE